MKLKFSCFFWKILSNNDLLQHTPILLEILSPHAPPELSKDGMEFSAAEQIAIACGQQKSIFSFENLF
jgi:hypothetical protein